MLAISPGAWAVEFIHLTAYLTRLKSNSPFSPGSQGLGIPSGWGSGNGYGGSRENAGGCYDRGAQDKYRKGSVKYRKGWWRGEVMRPEGRKRGREGSCLSPHSAQGLPMVWQMQLPFLLQSQRLTQGSGPKSQVPHLLSWHRHQVKEGLVEPWEWVAKGQ